MSKFKIKEETPTEVTRITRIEIRCDGRSKVIVLNQADTSELYKFLINKLNKVVETIKVNLPILVSPTKQIPKCRIQIFEANNKSISNKENFKSFTCYGINEEKAFEIITDIIKK